MRQPFRGRLIVVYLRVKVVKEAVFRTHHESTCLHVYTYFILVTLLIFLKFIDFAFKEHHPWFREGSISSRII